MVFSWSYSIVCLVSIGILKINKELYTKYEICKIIHFAAITVKFVFEMIIIIIFAISVQKLISIKI